MSGNFLTTALFGKCHDLRKTDFRGAKLGNANLIGAVLGDWYPVGSADLSSTDLIGVNLSNALLIGTNLSSTNLSFADLSNANLYGANLSNANLSNAKLNGANLIRANLIGANFTSVNLSNANLHGAIYNKVTKLPDNFDLTKEQMLLIAPGVNLSGVELNSVNFDDADFRGINLSNANLNESILSNANLSNANLSNANLSNANLSNANLSNANLKKAIYNRETKLPKNFDPTKEQMLLIAPGVNLSGADLSSINFWFTDFQAINLTNANLEGSNLSKVYNLTPEQVKAAKNWEKAKYNDWLRIKLGLK
ncbi:MAG: hypothetical protein HC785_30295 [Calothrix sp. CSU_2_0]|nr:hypothetical protein [Calothrix sp. CSU_2_0]